MLYRTLLVLAATGAGLVTAQVDPSIVSSIQSDLSELTDTLFTSTATFVSIGSTEITGTTTFTGAYDTTSTTTITMNSPTSDTMTSTDLTAMTTFSSTITMVTSMPIPTDNVTTTGDNTKISTKTNNGQPTGNPNAGAHSTVSLGLSYFVAMVGVIGYIL